VTQLFDIGLSKKLVIVTVSDCIIIFRDAYGCFEH
jgi:hypothetical protein